VSIGNGAQVRFDPREVHAWLAAKRHLRACSFERQSVVYFGRQGNCIKIGFSSDVARRAIEEDLEILATVPGDKVVEGAIHKAFAFCHVDREWYAPDAKLMAAIATFARVGAAA
jgi:hypothetical protein